SLGRRGLCCLRRNHAHRAASLLDGGFRGFRRARDLEGELRLEFALGEKTHAVLGATDDTRIHERRGIHLGLGVELARIDGNLDAAEIDHIVIEPEQVLEAALGQAHVDRHLAALIALDRNARTGRLTLHAASAGLALAGADTAADTDARLAGARIIGDFVELHNLASRAVRPRPRYGR